MKKTLILIGIILSGVGIDQLTKILVSSNMSLYESFAVIPKVFNITYIQNRGAAFGMLSEHRWVFLIISTVAIAAIIFYMLKYKPKSKLERIAIAFMAGGGIGNMFDRIILGYVIDFIDFYAFPKVWSYIFNVADSFVCIGAGLLILYLIQEMIKEAKLLKEAKNEKLGEEENEN